MAKATLTDRIQQAIEKNDAQQDRVPLGKGPIFQPARSYLSPTDSYEDEIGPTTELHSFHPGGNRGMWAIADQQHASVPVTVLKSSGNTNNNFVAAIQGGIPQNPQAPAGVWSAIPQMTASIKTKGPVMITAGVSVHSTVGNDTMMIAVYRDGNLIGNPYLHVLAAGAESLKNIVAMDDPPIGNHVYAIYWKPGSGTLTAVNNYRNLYVTNLTPQ